MNTSNQSLKIIQNITIGSGYNMMFDHKKSRGSFLYDSISNKKYLDMFSFYASYPISYNHPDISNKKFKNYIGNIAIHNPSNSDIYTIEYGKFLSTFNKSCMNDKFTRAFFISGGALANENALKVAFDWKIKKNRDNGIPYNINHNKVIHFKEAFHGRSGYTLSLTNTDPIKYINFPLFDSWPRILNPKIEHPITEENIFELVIREQKALTDIENLLVHKNEEIACIIIEPIQGEGGDNHFRTIFMEKLRELANKYNVLLIMDEIQSGVGLTGKMWAHQYHNVVPDIVVFGKKMQVCGFMCTERVSNYENVLDANRINSTWGGNLVDMVRSTKFLEIIESRNLIDNAYSKGKTIMNYLYELQKEFPIISNIRGKGLMIAFDLPNPCVRNNIIEIAFNRQLLLLPCGNNSIRLRPFLDINSQEINMFMRILSECLHEETSKDLF